MAAKKKIRTFYRAPTHAALWRVMEEGGFLAKHGLETDLGSMEDNRKAATEGLLEGTIDIVSGNHHSLYARRALYNEPFVHIGQVHTQWNQHWLVAKDGVKEIQDLKGKRITINKRDGHPGLNVWRYLQLNGLEAGSTVELLDGSRRGMERVAQVLAGEYDATFIGAIDALRARKMGASVIDVPTFPMIEGVTLTTTTRWVNAHPEEAGALLRAVVDAIHYFKTDRAGTLAILHKNCRYLLRVQSDDELETFYEEHARIYQRKPYPTLEAIQNVFALGMKESPQIAGFNPLVMWDLHHLRAIDDSGYIDRLYV